MKAAALAHRISNARWHAELRFDMARVSTGKNQARLLRESLQWAREKEILMGANTTRQE